MSTDFTGKTLESLSDDDIRAIAEDWLLAALKDSNTLRLETASHAPFQDCYAGTFEFLTE